jgi:hypothetical protein
VTSCQWFSDPEESVIAICGRATGKEGIIGGAADTDILQNMLGHLTCRTRCHLQNSLPLATTTIVKTDLIRLNRNSRTTNSSSVSFFSLKNSSNYITSSYFDNRGAVATLTKLEVSDHDGQRRTRSERLVVHARRE